MSERPYQSPISPGRSYYEDSVAARPRHPPLQGDASADVAIIGGGFTGLSAAVHLARAGVSTILLEAHRLGDGASGRNGGQFGTGNRLWPEEIEPQIGLERSRLLFALAQEAKQHVLDFAAEHAIEADIAAGQLSVIHRRRFADDYRRHADRMAEAYDYPHLSWHAPSGLAPLLGSTAYHGGLRDAGTYHLNPLKLLIGTARAAQAAGARLHEDTHVDRIRRTGSGFALDTPHGIVTASRVLMATNAHGGTLDAAAAAHIMPIRSYMVATQPLDDPQSVLPGGEAVDDSRFVVRYFRKSADGRLLFGGREAYMSGDGDIAGPILRQIAEIYPHLAATGVTHAWGGSVGITMTRMPYVAVPQPGLTVLGGFSGHGVMLSNYFGRLYAQAVCGGEDRLLAYRDLRVPAFPGGHRFRNPLLFLAMSWFSLRDRL